MNPWLVLVASCVLSGCVKAPAIVMGERATTLEQASSGSFAGPDQKLDRSSVEPAVAQPTPAQLRALGIQPAPLVDASELTDADRLDGFLMQHCLGEGRDGLIVDTHDACQSPATIEDLIALAARVNSARRQLWHALHERRTALSEAELQRAWRERHIENVVCGGWVEQADGTWHAKAC